MNILPVTRRARSRGALAALALISVVTAACAALPADNVRPAQNPGQPTVVIVRSSDNPIYDRPIQWFSDIVPGRIATFTYAADKDSALARAIKAEKPGLVFTLGAQATVFARSTVPDVPTLFAMVLDYDRLKITEQPQVAGIALETSTTNSFAQFRLILPNMKKVLAFHSQGSDALATRAKGELDKLGIELVTIKVTGPDDVKAKFPASLAGYDAIWQINDPLIVTESEFYFLRDKSKELRVPFLASLAEEFAQAGATAAVSVDLTSLGAQAGSLANAILGGKAPQSIGVQPPIGAYLAFNLDVAKVIGVEVPQASLNNINKIISKDTESARVDEGDDVAAKTGDAVVAQADTPDATTKPDGKTGKTDKPDGKPHDGKTAGTKPDGKPDGKTDPKVAVKTPDGKAGDTKPDTGDAAQAVRKPRTGRTVVFYDPDANHEAILQITNWFTEFLHSVDPQLRLQPVRGIGTFERMAKNGQADFAILPASYVQRRGKAEKLVPLLVPTSKGETRYKKILFANGSATKVTTIAATVAGGSPADVLKTLAASGVSTDGVTIIPVSKDIDALLALVFGQVEGALVMPESVEVVKTIQPGAENLLRKVQETKPVVRPPLCAVSDVVTPELQAKLVAAMRRMSADPSGARAMRTLGFDGWVAFDPSMLR